MSIEHAKLVSLIAEDEGYRDKPYRCTNGKLTIGYGHNLEAKGVSKMVALLMLYEDVQQAELEASPYLAALTPVRQAVVISMIYQMGLDGFKGFKKMLAAIYQGAWVIAAAEMLDSDWARKDSPERAKQLAEMMRTGRWPS
jgi:lysozyme